MFLNRLFRGKNLYKSSVLNSYRNFKYASYNALDPAKLLHDGTNGDTGLIRNSTPRTCLTAHHPTHNVQPCRSYCSENPKQSAESEMRGLPMVFVTFRYSFKLMFMYLMDKDFLNKMGIKGPKFLKGLVYAMHSVSTEIASRNLEYLENILTDECLEKVKNLEGIASKSVSEIEPINMDDISALRILDMKVHPIPNSKLKNIDILIQFTTMKGFKEFKKSPLSLEDFFSRTQLANVTFTRQFGMSPEDRTDWLIKNVFFFKYNDKLKVPRRL